jgi:hypothetical protein
MNVRTRKFIGTIILVFLALAYAILATTFAVGIFGDSSTLWALPFFLVAGLFWVVPAMFVIRWMQRPDAQ